MKFKPYYALTAGLFLLSACSQKLAVTGKERSSPAILKVMSYNVHHCNPPSKPDLIDVDAIAEVIKKQQPDVVALQEIDVNTVRSGGVNQADLIAEKTGMNVYFAKSIDHDGGDYGVAILSKYPLSKTKTERLPSDAATKGEPRVLATAVVRMPDGRELLFGCTHLDAQKATGNRLMQVREINRIADSVQLPFIIAGDLNARPGSGVIDLWDTKFTRTCRDCAFTIPVINPTATIDHIAFLQKDKFKVLNHEVIDEQYASDHLPVLAVIELLR